MLFTIIYSHDARRQFYINSTSAVVQVTLCLMVCTCRMLERIYIFMFPDNHSSSWNNLGRVVRHWINIIFTVLAESGCIPIHLYCGRCMWFSCKHNPRQLLACRFKGRGEASCVRASCEALTIYMVTGTATIMDLAFGTLPYGHGHRDSSNEFEAWCTYIGLGGTGSSSIASGITW
jgi:hypothetical protein